MSPTERPTEQPTDEALRTAHCWENDDRVPRRPAMTDFRRRARYHQATWREANGHPIGTQPIAPKPGAAARPMGSRLPVDYARRTGATFLTSAARAAAEARLARVEAHQSIDRQRLWADLLWSPALACNLFGDLARDVVLADRVVHAWWPDVPGTVVEVRLLHSPGWLDHAYLHSLVSFDALFVLDLGGGERGAVAVDVKYHEPDTRALPKPANLARYLEVHALSAEFGPDALDAVNGTELTEMWLEHLLLCSMLQLPGGPWRFGRYVVVYPTGNTDVADAGRRYRHVLNAGSTFRTATLESLLDTGALPRSTEVALRNRYLFG